MEYIEAESYNMSTITHQKVQLCTEGKVAIAQVKEELISLEKQMSFYLKDSEISKINQNSGIKPVEVSLDTIHVIEKSIEYSSLTNGFFDITLAPVIEEWGIFSDHEKVPSEFDLNKLISLVGYKEIIINKNDNSILLKNKGAKVDLGGIAKGYATDKAMEIYKSHNIKSAMINLGGNVAVLGKKLDDTPWIVGIQNPARERGNMLCAVSCEDTSIVTSGNYVRNFKKDNHIYGHIISTSTGRPINSSFISVTVICRLGVKADALATAIFAMDFKDAIKFINKNQDIDTILVTDDREIYVSKNLKEKLYIVDEDYRYYYC